MIQHVAAAGLQTKNYKLQLLLKMLHYFTPAGQPKRSLTYSIFTRNHLIQFARLGAPPTLQGLCAGEGRKLPIVLRLPVAAHLYMNKTLALLLNVLEPQVH